MRGRASGLGARISANVLLIVVGKCIVERVAGEVHRPDYLLDEGYLTRGEGIFRVEVRVCPPPGPILGWHKGIDFARDVLGRLVQENQEASQPTGEIAQNALGLGLGVKRAD